MINKQTINTACEVTGPEARVDGMTCTLPAGNHSFSSLIITGSGILDASVL